MIVWIVELVYTEERRQFVAVADSVDAATEYLRQAYRPPQYSVDWERRMQQGVDAVSFVGHFHEVPGRSGATERRYVIYPTSVWTTAAEGGD